MYDILFNQKKSNIKSIYNMTEFFKLYKHVFEQFFLKGSGVMNQILPVVLSAYLKILSCSFFAVFSAWFCFVYNRR